MKKMALILITVLSSLSFARNEDVPADRDDATDCFDAIQKGYAEAKGKDFAEGRKANFTINPSQIILGKNGEIAWVDDDGTMKINHPHGSVTVAGNSCDYKNRGSDTRSIPLGKAYMYLWQYGDKIANPVLKVCSKIPGIVPPMGGGGMMMGGSMMGGSMMGASGGGMMGVGGKPLGNKRNIQPAPELRQDSPAAAPAGTQK